MELQLTINLQANVVECLNALIERGEYGRTAEEVIAHMLNHKVFRLKDVKDATIWGLLKRGKDKGWIIHNIPALRPKNSIDYNKFLREAELSELPEDVRERLSKEKEELGL